MTNFQNALATGKTLVRNVWVNENNSDQVGIQFMQQIETSEGVSPSLALQGIKSTRKLTVIASAKKETLEAVGLKIQNYAETDEVLFANDLYKSLGVTQDVNISLEENHDKYVRTATGTIAYRKDGSSIELEPKVNPTSGEVVKVNGKEVYAHTSISFGMPKRTFLRNESVQQLQVVEA